MTIYRILFLTVVLFYFDAYSQTSNNNSWIFKFEKNIEKPFTQFEMDKIIDAYGAKKLQTIISEKALENFYKNILRNRVKIYTKKYYPEENFPKISSIGPSLNENDINTEKFNPLLYDFPFYSKKPHYYRVSQTDFLVVINPQELE